MYVVVDEMSREGDEERYKKLGVDGVLLDLL